MRYEVERRRHPRFPQALEIEVNPMPPFDVAETPLRPILGRAQNMSKGGICFSSQQPVSQSSLLRCEMNIADAPVTVPTLLLVRWTKKAKIRGNNYLCGLQFLF
ncbi:MAG: PilZ domain-containing protein [Candidatus Sulfotelmatobacter sp.]